MWFIVARSIQWKLMIFFDSKKCILLQHTCGISIATMIASEKGLGSWSGGSLLFYTADTYTTKKKYTLISCDNSLFAYQYVSCSRNFSFLSFFFFFSFLLSFRKAECILVCDRLTGSWLLYYYPWFEQRFYDVWMLFSEDSLLVTHSQRFFFFFFFWIS